MIVIDSTILIGVAIIVLLLTIFVALLAILLGMSLGLWRNTSKEHEYDKQHWRERRLQRITDEIGKSRRGFPEYSFKKFFDGLEERGL